MTPDGLLDLGVVGAAEIAATESEVARMLQTDADVLLIQAEAVLALEASAKSLAGPGTRALNIVTGPYGALYGRWLAGTGARVSNLPVPFHRAVRVSEVVDRLRDEPVDLLAVVHAEAATGSANPVEEIAEVAARYGAMLVVDAVASVGAHPVTPDRWGADIVVIGGQKALAGPAGVSALTVSERAWDAMARNLSAPRESVLSLLDLRDGWLATDRSSWPGTPSSLETTALRQALTRVQQEGLPAVIDRHRRAAAATRAGLLALRLRPWIAEAEAAAAVVTTVAVPDGWSVPDLLAAAAGEGTPTLTAAPGILAATTLRVNHTGRAAAAGPVLAALAGLASALGRPAGPVLAAAEAVWSAA